MNRKIIQAGPVTLALSLPMRWVKRFRLKKGQELMVDENGNTLKVSTISPSEEGSAVIDVTSLDPIPTKIIGVLYKAGYKRIKAFYTPNRIVSRRGKDVKEIDMIRNTFDHLTGMQLWDMGNRDGKHYATAAETAKVSPEEFDNVLNKLYLHLTAQAEQVSDALANRKDIYDEALLAERLISQTSDFCIRILVMFGHPDYRKTLQYYDLISKLESIGDRYFTIARNLGKADRSSAKPLQRTVEYLKTATSLCRKFDMGKARSFVIELKEEIDAYEKSIKEGKIKASIESYQVYSILLELFDMSETIYFLNHEVFKEK